MYDQHTHTPTHPQCVYDLCVGTSRLFEYGETNKKNLFTFEAAYVVVHYPPDFDRMGGGESGREGCFVFLVRSKMRGCASIRVCAYVRETR